MFLHLPLTMLSTLPPNYVVRRLPPGAPPLKVDGNLDKAEWSVAPWSEPFDEIRGAADAPEGTRPTAGCRGLAGLFKVLYGPRRAAAA